ncbi:ABC-three component system middle component 7 [Fictibacillus sp. WQ 8-8]|uniref:ABC-three component system middle component 7 n=1 Tax=Fictibacillus sp. WQ 8-8 TaxID=2938788 RepID=UPI0035C67FC2
MKLPNKLFSYKESVISKFPIILFEIKEKKHITIYQLYLNVVNEFESTAEFIETLECLYTLGKIDYDYNLRRIINAV